MTKSQTSTEVQAREQVASTTPTRDDVVAAIISDAATHNMTVPERVAAYIVDMFETAATQIREWRSELLLEDPHTDFEPMYYLSEEDLKVSHDILDAIMPDDTVPDIGSAPDQLGRLFLAGKEMNFIHTKGYEGRREGHCSVAVAIDRTDAS